MQSAPHPQSRPGTLISIQVLRAVACLMVLVHHARNPRPWMFDPMVGWNLTTGVDIFFVISGFIMFAAAREDAPAEFMRRRVIRIAPLYWIATLTWAAWLAFRDLPTPDAAHLWLSLGLIPHESPMHANTVWPVLVPGWTLTFEMGFYLLFALGLAVRRLVPVTTVAILALVAAGFLFKPEAAVVRAFTGPILLAFLAGVWIAWAHAKASFAPLWRHAWPLALAGGLGLGLHATPLMDLPKIWVVASSAALVAGALAFEPMLRARRPKVMELLGDASYAIYLFHTLVLAMVMWQGRKLPLEGWPQFLTLMALGCGLSTLVGVAVHLWVEKPMLRVLLRLRLPGLASRTPGPARPAPEAAG
jgi:exopolysaccharide production protein ExoZ